MSEFYLRFIPITYFTPIKKGEAKSGKRLLILVFLIKHLFSGQICKKNELAKAKSLDKAQYMFIYHLSLIQTKQYLSKKINDPVKLRKK